MTATEEQIVECFNRLEYPEKFAHNWGTCGRDCPAKWSVNDETYINGVMMTLDFDFIMGYLIQAVDRTSGRCRYITVLQRNGRRRDGSIEHDWELCPTEHEFFAERDSVAINQWAVSSIYRMLKES